ncbi:SGNH/GDSL hydrolase family protein [Candidatus Saccharibacteria bacterium]|nr:SGNH/GDSL hydrolase family protein [Candidatus Saccharibacteria bacterium]
MKLLGLFGRKIRLLVFLLFLSALVFPASSNNSQKSSAQQSASPWLAQEQPVLKNLAENIPFDQVPHAVYGSQECLHYEKFILKPFKKAGPLNPTGQNESSFMTCGMDTAFGTMSNNYLIRSGSNITGLIYSDAGTQIKLFGIPNSNDAYTLDKSAPTGTYIDIERNISQRLSTNPDKITGAVKHTLSGGAKQRVKDEKGDPLAAFTSAGGFSGNGQFMVFDSPGIGLVSLDISTGNVLIFAPGYRYDIGLTPSLQMAITNDGRYVSVMSGTYGTFRIFDLNTCVKSPTLNKPANCQSRDLSQSLKVAMPDHTGTGSTISFTDNYTLKFYGATRKDNVTKRHSQLLTAYGQTPIEFPYLALGDSFSSGEGAYSYKAGTDVKSPLNKCHLSLNSYPFLIARDLGIEKYESIACSGAKIKDINFDIRDDSKDELRALYNNEERQSHGLETIGDEYVLSNFLPGYRTQYRFVEKYKPSKVTISISGNDIGFSHIVERCVVGIDDCYSKTEERVKLVDTINQRFGELQDVLRQLKEKAEGGDIYVVGYPRMVDLNGSCGNNVRVSSSERIFFDNLTTYLNSVIEKAAKKAGVFYVDVSGALENNQLCESGVAEMAVNGLTVGNDTWLDIGPVGKESYHPNELGHSLLRNKILEKTNNFRAKNPYPDKTIADPKREDAANFIGTTNFDPFDLSYIQLTNMSDGLWYKDKTQTVNAEGFAPESQVSGAIHSEPTSVGVFIANENGEISETISVPSALPPGYHTFVLSGENESGEKIELQQQIYVAASAGDIDSNGIADTHEQCPGIGASGVDYDQDGVDDACDGYIGEPPAPPPQEETPSVDVPEIIDDVTELPDIISTPGETESEGPGGRDDDIIPGVNPTNTNSAQGQQNGSNLQSGGTQAQTTAGGLQTGATTNISGDGNTLEYLSTSSTSQPLSVGVASAGTSTASTTPAAKDTGMSAWVLWVLAIAFALAAIWLYKKFMKNSPPEKPEETPVELSAVANYVKVNKPKKDKKHKKKKTKPHHH